LRTNHGCLGTLTVFEELTPSASSNPSPFWMTVMDPAITSVCPSAGNATGTIGDADVTRRRDRRRDTTAAWARVWPYPILRPGLE
jgi:hypothetical protein